MMIYNLRNNFFFIFMSCAALLWPAHAVAVLNVKPEMQTIEISGGKVYKGFILVTNTTPEKIHVDVQPEDWTDRNNKITEGLAWLKVKPASFDLRPGKTKKVKVSGSFTAESLSSRITQVF